MVGLLVRIIGSYLQKKKYIILFDITIEVCPRFCDGYYSAFEVHRI